MSAPHVSIMVTNVWRLQWSVIWLFLDYCMALVDQFDDMLLVHPIFQGDRFFSLLSSTIVELHYRWEVERQTFWNLFFAFFHSRQSIFGAHENLFLVCSHSGKSDFWPFSNPTNLTFGGSQSNRSNWGPFFLQPVWLLTSVVQKPGEAIWFPIWFPHFAIWKHRFWGPETI